MFRHLSFLSQPLHVTSRTSVGPKSLIQSAPEPWHARIDARGAWRGSASYRVRRSAPITFTAQQDRPSTSYEGPSPTEYAAAREVLGKAIEAAVKREDYTTAANLRNEMEHINSVDPSYSIRVQLEEAILGEKYEVAHQLKARLKELESLAMERLIPEPLGVHSEVKTSGIKVEAQSFYRPEESVPQSEEFVFGYSVKITNESDSIVQLIMSSMTSTDEDARRKQVKGQGVMGRQPTLPPGQSYFYTSNTRIRTPTGAAQGEYTMRALDDTTGEWKEGFQVPVAPFKLSIMDA